MTRPSYYTEAEEKLARAAHWRENYSSGGHCTLCGDRGFVDTRGTKTAKGVEVGCVSYCICPNGDVMRQYRTVIPPSWARPNRWRHERRGTTYRVVFQGTMQAAAPAPDMCPVTVYASDEDGAVWVRPTAEFEDGRFEELK